MALPIVVAAFSPYLVFRDATYIIAGFAGIICLSLFVLQPLLSTRLLFANPILARRLHRIVGIVVLMLVVIHVVGLYFTSPPDVIDALLLRAPTLFSVFGVIALWGIFVTALIAFARRRLPSTVWRIAHQVLSTIVVLATVIHAVQIDGAMELITKWGISVIALATTDVSLVWLNRRP